MADPLSIAGLAAGLVSLSLQVTAGITQYLDALKCRAEELESTRKRNESLRQLLAVIDTTVVKTQSRHQAPSQAVANCVKQCETGIQSLEDLVAEISGCDRGTWRSKLQLKSKNLRYAFDRSKVQQLDTRLSQVNELLAIALQVLGVDLGQSTFDKVTEIGTLSQGFSTDLQATRSEIASLHTLLRRIESRSYTIQHGVDQLYDTITTRHEVDSTRMLEVSSADSDDSHATQALTAGSLSRQKSQFEYNSYQKTELDEQQHVVKKLIPESTQITRGSSDIGILRFENQMVKRAGNISSTIDKLTFDLSLQGRSSYKQSPSVQYNRIDRLDSASHPTCICTDFRRTCSQVVMKVGALIWYKEKSKLEHWPPCPFAQLARDGHYSKTFGVRCMGLVKTLKAAVEISLTITLGGTGGLGLGPHINFPPAVDERIDPVFRILDLIGRSFHDHPSNDELFKCADIFEWLTTDVLFTGLWEAFISSGVNVLSYDMRGNLPIAYLSGQTTSYQCARLLLQRDDVGYPAVTSLHARDGGLTNNQIIAFKLLPGLGKAYGCGPLSTAVLSNDLYQVRYLLQAFPDTINERNTFGHTPVHLAVGSPDCLRVVTNEYRLSSDVLNHIDNSWVSPLDRAMSLSGALCNSDADCAVPEPIDVVLERSSRRAMELYARHMADRRSRLREFALQHGPILEKECFRLGQNEMLDTRAYNLLEVLDKHGLRPPSALTLGRIRAAPASEKLKLQCCRQTIYETLTRPWEAALFWRWGFRDLENALNGFIRNRPRRPTYLRWLVEHGANTPPSLQSTEDDTEPHLETDVMGAYCVGQSVTEWLFREGRGLQELTAAKALSNPLGATHTCCGPSNGAWDIEVTEDVISEEVYTLTLHEALVDYFIPYSTKSLRLLCLSTWSN
ncbi:hypothetical protein PG996_002748 [Apiospora saccharicola]|uniref:Fungal N-terminal domain-containing protein n=1 Tax=Apiospora saccharicola TaxID=335842 RepID=A0ABR1WKE5_9PEZI